MSRIKTLVAAGSLFALAAVPVSMATAAPTAAPASNDRGAALGAAFVQQVAAERAQAPATAQALGLDSREGLVVRDVVRDPDGTTYTRYDRTFSGLKVIGGDLIVARAANGATKDVQWGRGKSVAVAVSKPSLPLASAQAAADSRLGGVTKKGSSTSALVVFVTEQGPRLAYDMLTTGYASDQTESRLHVFVDAHSGAVLDSWDEVNQAGDDNGVWDRQVNLTTTLSGGTYRMDKGDGTVTSDMNQGTSGSGTVFTSATNTWGNGSQSNRQSAGVDAHFGAETTYAYYANVQGRAGIWGTGRGAPSRVHYGSSYNNAFWNGSSMTYGDTTNNAAPLTSLDVAGHEMSHGVTENTARLVYRGESGGLNEATSDIFGTAVEFYANLASDTPDYLIGELLNLRGDGTPLRWQDRPSRDGRSPDCYSSRIGRLDVHYSSGPLNHWFYLASEGSGAKTINGVAYNSPTCNGATVTGAGHSAIEKVWFRTLTTKLTSTSGYAAAREGAIRSAKELYGKNSAVCASVQSAFDAISVPKGTQTCAN